MENKIKNVMISVFEIDSSEINHESSPDSIDKWDSLRHMNLVVALEEEFNIEFEVEEISELMNFKLICEVISKKLI
jgi:acyl carrier protein